MKNILVIGGTLFLGRVLIEHLLKNTNHSITLFNRGKTNTEIFPQLKKIVGDRYNEEDFKQIAENKYDCIIDTSGYFPDAMEKELKILKNKVKRYIFISTISVYDFSKIQGIISEDCKLQSCSFEDKVDSSIVRLGNINKPIPSLYGKKKAECERLLLNCDWLDSIIFRPGIVYGRYDFCDRYYYWLYRVKTQCKILLPDRGRDVQNNTFVEDFVEIIRQAIDIEKHSNTYNIVTHHPKSLSDTLNVMERVLNTRPLYINANKFFLKINKVSPYSEIPALWDGCDLIVDNKKLKRDFNCSFNSFEESIRKTVAFYDEKGWEEGRDGMSIRRERELIEKIEKIGIKKTIIKWFLYLKR